MIKAFTFIFSGMLIVSLELTIITYLQFHHLMWLLVPFFPVSARLFHFDASLSAEHKEAVAEFLFPWCQEDLSLFSMGWSLCQSLSSNALGPFPNGVNDHKFLDFPSKWTPLFILSFPFLPSSPIPYGLILRLRGSPSCGSFPFQPFPRTSIHHTSIP